MAQVLQINYKEKEGMKKESESKRDLKAVFFFKGARLNN